MSGNWNRKPRKGEKSIDAARSDQEHRVRVEYRDAGRIEGLVMAWSRAERYAAKYDAEGMLVSAKTAHELARGIAADVLQDFPKAGRVALANAGASLADVDDAENIVAQRRRLLAQARTSAKPIGDDVDGA